MTERIVENPSTSLGVILRAAAPVLPGFNLLPGMAKKGGDIPDLTLRRPPVAIDAHQVAAYRSVCGFDTSSSVPLTYPHMLAFGLHMALMLDPSFPFPALGTVHLANSITRRRRIAPTEELAVMVRPDHQRAHAKGTMFDFVTELTSGDEPVWESTSTYLRLGKDDKQAAAEGEPFDVVPGDGPEWRLAANLGRRYAAVSGDRNPIHLYPLTAKALGFKRQIVHGMWSKARCVAAVESRLAEEVTVEVEFRKPIFLPGSVDFGSRTRDAGIDFALTDPGKPTSAHLVGRTR